MVYVPEGEDVPCDRPAALKPSGTEGINEAPAQMRIRSYDEYSV